MDLLAGHSVVDITTNPTSDGGRSFFQDPALSDVEWINSLPLGIPEINNESALTPHIDGTALTLYPENLITNTHDDELVIYPSDAMDWTAFPWSPSSAYVLYTPLKPTMRGPEGLGSPPVVPNEGPTYINTTSAYMTADVWEPATLSGIFHFPDVMQKRRGSGDSPQRLHKLCKGPTMGSSRTDRRQADARGAPKPKGPYLCNVQGCSKEYKQPQGLRLHYREKHSPNLCTYCGVFKWARPYRYRQHLENRHPDVDLKTALDEARQTYHSATITKGYPRRQQFSPFTPELDRSGDAESRPYLLASSTLGVVKPPSISPVAVSLADYSLQPRAAEPTIWIKHRHEDSPQLQVLSARTRVSSSEEYAQPTKGMEMSTRSAQTSLLTRPGGRATPNLVLPPIPLLALPTSGTRGGWSL
ncbi:hypothetical protein BJV74DRAFT_953355 [Russula compacta]|nr:hypothetical protein BJV74DRAFT_953355 [Russula compacta]